MYRQNYPDQNINSSMQSLNPPMSGYDYRNSALLYKSPNPLENMITPIHQSHQMYYQTQTIPQPVQLQQNPYMNMMPVESIDQNYDMSRYYWRQMQPPKHNQNYQILPSHPNQYSSPPPPQLNIVQRISSLIKSQLPLLQNMMSQISSNYNPPRSQSRRQVSRSRSRSKSRHRKSPDSSHDWLCRKCSFSNYDWRDSCKKCNQARPSRSFVPGPQDWKCVKCGNINYARRMECNRCKRPKSD